MDRLRALEVLIAVADTGGFAPAARRLSISAPSVTRLIQELETDLDLNLLHRTTRRVTLTDSGETLVSDARRLLDDYQAARDAARGAYSAPTGQLRITAPTLFGQYYISPVILECLDAYPELSVDAVYLDRVVSLVEEGFDVAVRIGELPDSNLRAVRVGSVRRVVCGCPSYFREYGIPQVPADLREHRIVASRPATPTDDWRFADGSAVRVTPRLAFNSNAAAIAAVRRSGGLTRLLSYQIGPELDGGDLQTVLSDHEPPAVPVHIVHAEGRRASAKVRCFIELATERLREHPYLC